MKLLSIIFLGIIVGSVWGSMINSINFTVKNIEQNINCTYRNTCQENVQVFFNFNK